MHSRQAPQTSAGADAREGGEEGRVTCSTSAAHLAGSWPSCLNARRSALRGSCGQHGEALHVLAPSDPRLATILRPGAPTSSDYRTEHVCHEQS